MTREGIRAVILRHPREKLSKCTLEPLRGRPGLQFHRARPGFAFDAAGMVLLSVDAPPLTPADSGRPLLLLDSTWRLLPRLEACVRGEPSRRSLPGPVPTAYPRCSKVGDDPEGGLASVEALYLALRLTGFDDPSLLEHYRWRDAFLAGLEQAGFRIAVDSSHETSRLVPERPPW